MRRAIKIHDQTKYKEFLEHSKAQHGCTPILVLVLRSSLSMRLLDLHVTIDFISFWMKSSKIVCQSWSPGVPQIHKFQLDPQCASFNRWNFQEASSEGDPLPWAVVTPTQECLACKSFPTVMFAYLPMSTYGHSFKVNTSRWHKWERGRERLALPGPPSTMWGYGSDGSKGHYKPLPDSESPGALMVDIWVSKTVGHKALLILKQPG